MDERAVALVHEWWNEGPVSVADGPTALMDDVRSLFAHLRANGYDIVPVPQSVVTGDEAQAHNPQDRGAEGDPC